MPNRPFLLAPTANFRSSLNVFRLAGLSAALLISANAHAQNALGTGNALDANQRLGSGGINERGRDLNAIIRQANAVVDGTAGAGRSFRGLGATPSNSGFRDSLGGAQTYRFERDAVLSGLATSRARTTDLLSAQAALYSGEPVGPRVFSALNPREYGAVSTGGQLTALRSVAQREWDAARQPSVLGVVTGRDEADRQVTYQPLRGLSFSERDRTDLLPLSPLQRPAGMRLERAIEESKSLGGDAQGRDERLPTGVPLDPIGSAKPLSTRIEQNPISTRFDEVESRFRSSFSAPASTPLPGDGTVPPADGRLMPERREANARPDGRPDTIPGAGGASNADPLERLRGRLSMPAAPERAARTPATTGITGLPGARPTTLVAPLAGDRLAATMPPALPSADDQAVINALRKMTQAEPLKDLSGRPADANDWYHLVMLTSQQLVNKGEFFKAEEAYTRLLAAKPGDALARLGRSHAQIGAGTYLSAGRGLLELVRERPQLIGTRIDEGGLLPRAYADAAAAELLAKAQQTNPQLPASPVATEAAATLAYLGFQFKQEAWLIAGLNAGLAQADARDKPLFELMSAAWRN